MNPKHHKNPKNTSRNNGDTGPESKAKISMSHKPKNKNNTIDKYPVPYMPITKYSKTSQGYATIFIKEL